MNEIKPCGNCDSDHGMVVCHYCHNALSAAVPLTDFGFARQAIRAENARCVAILNELYKAVRPDSQQAVRTARRKMEIKDD